MKFEHILTAFEAEPWAIQREKLAVLADVLAARVAGDKLVTPEFAAAVSDARAKEIAEIDGKVAVIPVYGVLADRMDLFSAMSGDRKSTRLNSSHVKISYAVFCLKKKKN